MPPLANAVRFVDDEEGDGASLYEIAEVAVERFGGEVDQLVVPAAEAVEACPSLVRVERGVNGGDAIAQFGDGVDLVLHEGDERRNDQDGAAEQTRGELVGERFSGAGWHERDTIAAREDGIDDLALSGAEFGVTEDVAEDLLGGGAISGGFVHDSGAAGRSWAAAS